MNADVTNTDVATQGSVPSAVAVTLVESIFKVDAAIARKYLNNFKCNMSSAELIGCYRKIIDSGCATDAEECAFLDLIDPSQQ